MYAYVYIQAGWGGDSHTGLQDVTALPACRATGFPRHLAWTRSDTGHAYVPWEVEAWSARDAFLGCFTLTLIKICTICPSHDTHQPSHSVLTHVCKHTKHVPAHSSFLSTSSSTCLSIFPSHLLLCFSFSSLCYVTGTCCTKTRRGRLEGTGREDSLLQLSSWDRTFATMRWPSWQWLQWPLQLRMSKAIMVRVRRPH